MGASLNHQTFSSLSLSLPLEPVSAAAREAAARQVLLQPFGLDEAKLDALCGKLRTKGIDDGDLYLQLTSQEAWSLEDGMVKSGSFSIDQGVGVRAVSGDKSALAYSDDISAEAIEAAAKIVRQVGKQASAGAAQKLPLARARAPAQNGITAPSLYATSNPILGKDSAAKVALLERVEALARKKDPRVVQVMASLAAEHDVVWIASLSGHHAADVRPLVRLSVTVIVQSGERRETGSGGGGGRFALAAFDDACLERFVDDAVKSALVNLEARPAPAGEFAVVLGPGWPGILLHEAIGHGLEGDFNRKGSSAFSGRVGQRVAAKGVTVLDDGTLSQRRGSLNVDDEGHATQSTVLIEDGILRGYLQDRTNARLMGVPQTGNGRRESYAHMPVPRMTNTYMLAGKTPAEEVLASLKKGVFAKNFGGGQVDITSGKFVFAASEAYWVENGKIQYPIKGATLIGNGPDALTRVSMIGNDLALDSGVGTCGKEGQSVPVGVGQPTIRVEGLTVGGTAQ